LQVWIPLRFPLYVKLHVNQSPIPRPLWTTTTGPLSTKY
jgi:hypothetical protein